MQMNIISGIILIAISILIVCVGDKKINPLEGKVGRMLSMPVGKAKFVKRACAFLCFLLGVWLIISR